MVNHPVPRRTHAALRHAWLVPAVATLLSVLVLNPGVFDPTFLLFLVTPPTAALAVNWWRPEATTSGRALLAALPQVIAVPVAFVIGSLAVEWSGEPTADDRRELAFVSALFGGAVGVLVVMPLVAIFGRLGARFGQRW